MAGLAYCVALGIWYGMLARLIGTGLFGQVLGLTLATTAAALVAIGLAYVLDAESGAFLLGGIAAAYLVGLLGWRLVTNSGIELSDGGSGLQRISLGRENYRMLVTLIGVTFATLILNNGGLVVAGFLDVDPRSIVIYGAALNLVRIPIMLINNVTPPINLRMVDLAADGAVAELRRLAVTTLAGFASIVALGFVATWILGPFFVRFLVGGGSGVEGSLVALVLLGEGLIWLTVLPRIVCVAIGDRRAMVVAWAAGLVSFLTWILLPIPNDWKVVGGPIVGGAVILVVGLILAARLLSPSQAAQARFVARSDGTELAPPTEHLHREALRSPLDDARRRATKHVAAEVGVSHRVDLDRVRERFAREGLQGEFTPLRAATSVGALGVARVCDQVPVRAHAETALRPHGSDPPVRPRRDTAVSGIAEELLPTQCCGRRADPLSQLADGCMGRPCQVGVVAIPGSLPGCPRDRFGKDRQSGGR